MRLDMTLFFIGAGVLLAACGSSGPRFECGPESCNGCCEADGRCRATSVPLCVPLGAACTEECLTTIVPEQTDSGAPPPEDAGENELRVFTSAAEFRGDLVTTAGIADPLRAADSLCQRVAESAELGGTWMAFLSADGGHPGHRFVADGPWRRVEGTKPLFSNKASVIYSAASEPLERNERGLWSEYRQAWTGYGDSPAASCEGWTSRGPAVGTVASPESMAEWSGGAGNPGCGGPHALYCFEQKRELPDGGAAQLWPGFAVKRTFVTSLAFKGDLGGRAGADSRCTGAAQAAGLSGTWRAWLGTRTSPAGANFTFFGPWSFVGSDRRTVAPNLEVLRLGILASAIHVTEHGTSANDVVGAVSVWSGSYAAALSGDTCADWTSNAATDHGHVGNTAQRTNRWQDFSATNCSVAHHLYCFEQ